MVYKFGFRLKLPESHTANMALKFQEAKLALWHQSGQAIKLVVNVTQALGQSQAATNYQERMV